MNNKPASTFSKAGETVYGRERAEAIDTLNAYTYAYDHKDSEAMERLLTEDHVWICYISGATDPAFHTTQRQQVLDWMNDRIKTVNKYDLAYYDLNLQPMVTWVDENTLHIKSININFIRSGNHPVRPVQNGESDSILVRGDDDKWRFKSREMHMWGRVDIEEIGRTLEANVPFPPEPQ